MSMVFFLMFCMFIAFMLFFLWVFLFPAFDEDFFLFGSEIDRYTFRDSFIEFFDIFTRDIVFPMCIEVPFYDAREAIDQNVEWLPLIFFMLFFLFSDFLDEGDDIARTSGAIESEFIISCKLDYDI